MIDGLSTAPTFHPFDVSGAKLWLPPVITGS